MMTAKEKLVLQFLLTFMVIGLCIGLVRRVWFPEIVEIVEDSAVISEKMRLIKENTSTIITQSDITVTNKISESTRKSTSISMDRININTASKNELMSLPGIGPAMAERIIHYREDYGNFSGLDDLDKVKGIGNKKLEKLKEKISF